MLICDFIVFKFMFDFKVGWLKFEREVEKYFFCERFGDNCVLWFIE